MTIETSRNNAEKTRGRPFETGNPGRPKGARNKVTLAVEALLDGEAEELTRRAIELAKAGDGTALRLCLERVLPARRDRLIAFELPAIETAADASRAMSAILRAVADGAISPSEGQAVAGLLEGFVKTLEATEFEKRLAALEGRPMK
jgi:hypothetical protein